MSTFPPRPDRLGSLSRLLKVFDQVRRPLSTSQASEPSEDYNLCVAGKISPEEYLRRRIDVSLVRLTPHLDTEDLSYLRHACFEYLRDDFVHTGLFRSILSRLRKPGKSGHIEIAHPSKGGEPVKQTENIAQKRENALGSEDLRALKSGEITVDEYLERRLERQIEVLNVGRLLTDEERERMRTIIRENFLKSPLFRHYTRAMTGKSDEEPT